MPLVVGKMMALDYEEIMVVVVVMVMVNRLGLVKWLEGDLSAWGFRLLVATRQGCRFLQSPLGW